MNKLQDLRQYLQHRLPELKRGEDRLLTFVENGQLETWPGENLSYRLTMPLRIIVTDWHGTTDRLFIALIEWLRVREPGFDPANSLRFESDIINSNTSDIMVSLQISERVIVKPKTDGSGYDIEHVLPPAPWQVNDDAELSMETESHR